jgi:SnoaL-like protein
VDGPDEVRAYFQGYRRLPDGRNELVNAVESPDGIVIEARFTGTNTGSMGETSPTGKREGWPFVVVLDMKNGKAKGPSVIRRPGRANDPARPHAWPGEWLAQAGRSLGGAATSSLAPQAD